MQTAKQSTYKIADENLTRSLSCYDLGLVKYSDAWELQKELYRLRLNGEISDTLLLLEHPHVYTLGKAANEENVIAKPEFIKAHGIEIFEIDRGGDVTYHGPGQIVGYAILNLAEWKKDAHEYLRATEKTIIRTCAEYGIETERHPKYTGVWRGDNKICAIGVKISRWITMHGFAFNVNTDLKMFDGIIPCGIKEKGVTSLSRELNREISLDEVKKKIVKNFAEVFGYENFTFNAGYPVLN